MKKSEIFWNSIGIFIQVTLGYYLLNLKTECGCDGAFFAMMQLVTSAIYLTVSMVSWDDWNNRFTFKVPLALKFCALGLVVYFFKSLKWIYKVPIKQFNTWMDTEKEKPLSFDQFKKKSK